VDKCSICSEDIKDDEPRGACDDTTCEHVFHADCLDQWLEINPSCPNEQCRRPCDNARARERRATLLQFTGQPSWQEKLLRERDPSEQGGGVENEVDECSICYEDIKDDEPRGACDNPECEHVFHEDCLDQWLEINPSCPLCRRPCDNARARERRAHAPPPRPPRISRRRRARLVQMPNFGMGGGVSNCCLDEIINILEGEGDCCSKVNEILIYTRAHKC